MGAHYSLTQFGWKPFFQQQLSLEDLEAFTVARVAGQERSLLHLLAKGGRLILPVTPSMPAITVGDWILLDDESRFSRLLERYSLFSRKAAGTKVSTQLVGSNIDTVFIVSSLNQDFNLNRLERYLALAKDAGVTPVIVLTKIDCCDNPQEMIEKAQSLDPMIEAIAVNSLDAQSVNNLKTWCKTGNTVAFLGSSGVGKSTLINTLAGMEIQLTNTIRDDDDKGRHTTTGRSLHLLSGGGLLLDTPGMRELQLADCEQGIEETFPEIVELAAHCRFSDCSHEGEPDCAVRAAIASGQLEERRLSNYQKLMREQAFNNATLAEKRARDRELGRYYRSVQESKRKKDK